MIGKVGGNLVENKVRQAEKKSLSVFLLIKDSSVRLSLSYLSVSSNSVLAGLKLAMHTNLSKVF